MSRHSPAGDNRAFELLLCVFPIHIELKCVGQTSQSISEELKLGGRHFLNRNKRTRNRTNMSIARPNNCAQSDQFLEHFANWRLGVYGVYKFRKRPAFLSFNLQLKRNSVRPNEMRIRMPLI